LEYTDVITFWELGYHVQIDCVIVLLAISMRLRCFRVGAETFPESGRD
jgi:hypothetical protein